MSTGGGTSFGEMVKQSMEGEMLLNKVPKEHWPQVDKEFAHARANPQSNETWAGSSYRFWADAIHHRPVDAMLQSDAALLLIQGSADTSTPVSNARMTLDMFDKAKHCNLTYWEFAGYSHGMQDAQGTSRMADVLAQAGFWLKQQLANGKPVVSCTPAK
jgi:alpha-beta hydrolase superfamily lysophospholipase